VRIARGWLFILLLLKCPPLKEEAFLMAKKFISLLAGMAFIGGAVTLFAQEGPTPLKAGAGTLMLQDKNYSLTHALAYETTINGEEVIAVVLSGQAISSDKLKEAKEAQKDSGFPDFKRPFLKLDFAKTGQLKFWSTAAGGTSIGRRSASKATGELKFQDSRVSGKASQPRDTDGMFPNCFRLAWRGFSEIAGCF
jgi:hypothetical protein